ncbi:MAG: fumarylacetoacetate hydrolase family protein [Pseudomonadota bacterium]
MKTILVDNTAVTPSKIVCVGRNYIEHVKELNNEIPQVPVFFLKPNSAIGEKLSSFHQEPLHYEGELCFVFGENRFCAVGFGLDITKRALQDTLKSKGLPWERAKAFDGSAVFSPFVSIDRISDNLRLELHINGQMIQSGHIQAMIFSPDKILASLSEFMTLYPGDVLMTGTPKGVGIIQTGDLFYAKVMDKDLILTHAEWQAV